MSKEYRLSRRDFMRAAALAASGAAVSVMLPGCKPKPAPPPAAELAPGMVDAAKYKKASPWTIGRAGCGDTNSWMVSFSAHFEWSFKERYKDLVKDYLVTAANWDPVKQIADVEDLLAKKIDLLVIDPVSEAAIVGTVESAMAAGIPVLLASTRVQTDNYVSWVTTNNVRMGFVCADWLCKQINGKGKVAITMGAPGSSYAAEWLGGTRQALAMYPDIKEVGLAYAYWSPVEAKKAWEAFLQKDPDINGVIPGGGLMGIGAIQAFLGAGKPIPPIGGGDDLNGFLRLAKETKVKFIGVSGGNEMAATVADLAIKVLKGEAVPKYVEHPFSVFYDADVNRLFRPDLNDEFWASCKLPAEWINRLFKQ